MQAFHNNILLQKELLDKVQGHYDADEIIHGVYWENGKGCALGCITHSNQHKDLESLYGIPEWIGRLIDILFEGMDNKYSKEFVLDFVKTITKQSFLGFDNWQHVFHQICLHILENICKHIDHPLVKQSICDIIILHKTEETDKEKWFTAGSAAMSAGSSAMSAGSAARFTGSAARFAAGSTSMSAGSAAMSAAGSTSMSAGSAAMSAGSAAMSAARFAGSAARFAAMSAGSAARFAAYKSIVDKLIELLEVKS